jgi:hypothetical protein
MVVEHPGLFDELEVAGVRGGRVRVHGDPVRVHHVMGRKGRAVMPGHAFPEMEGKDRLSFDTSPTPQVSHYVEVLVIFDESVVDESGHLMRRQVRSQDRDEVGGLPGGRGEIVPP